MTNKINLKSLFLAKSPFIAFLFITVIILILILLLPPLLVNIVIRVQSMGKIQFERTNVQRSAKSK